MIASTLTRSVVARPSPTRLQPRCCQVPQHHQSSTCIGMSAGFVAYPAASAGEQQAWEAALSGCGGDTTPDAAAIDVAAAAVPHPAAACQAEADAWEEALAGPRRQAQAPAQPQLFAVVEVGSHSTRLLLNGSRRGELARLSRDTHLGGSTSPAAPGAPRAIGAAAATATLAAVADFRQRIQAEQQRQPPSCVVHVAAVATAAVREAADGPQVAARISAALGHPLRVLTGQEEAELAFVGATGSLSLLRQSAPCLVIDLGGRSTELAAGYAGSPPLAAVSIPLGCLQLQHCQQQQDAAQAILAAHRGAVDSVVHALQHQQPATVVATGGTVTTLAALHLGLLHKYDAQAVHGSELSRTDVEALLAQALQQQELPAWVSDTRAVGLAPGCCGLLALLDVVNGGGGGGVEQRRVVVSDCDLLDGVLLQLLETRARNEAVAFERVAERRG